MRLSKTESVLLTVAVFAVVSFSGWLQSEMKHAARERNRHDIGTIVEAACANLNATELESSDNGQLQCGTIAHEAPRAASSAPEALTAAATGAASTVPNP
ncbi:hypothetical protein K788_0005243 [Paraburkholderia caribensis MBA4]|uniref:Uncharacterized protein n=1 Tax=Paraburkholderia caribensis MBA4 TaxID=1323664 RepID=A0A0P0RF45_9BURK|nr:hypothetical protein [Paraburkholderia caribensis]ALL67215.1 hypothetical protein K788_0005243 [Paraburkholderia caribensis MBA4]